MKQVVLGIEFDSNVIRIVECEGTPNNPRVLKAVSIMVTGDNQSIVNDRENFLAKFLKDELKKNDIKTKHATLGILNNDLHLKYIQMPTLSKSHFNEALRIQSGELLDLEIENYYYEHRFLGQVMESETIQNRYLVAAAKKSMINEYMSIFSLAGISLIDINATIYYTINLLNPSYRTGTYVLVYLGIENGYVSIMKHGMPQYAKKIKVRKMYEEAHMICGQPVPNYDKNFGTGVLDQFSEMLLNETLGTVNYYHMIDNEYMPNDFVFLGYGANKENLIETIQSKINLPVSMPEIIKMSKTDICLDDYAGALGAAITGLGVKF